MRTLLPHMSTQLRRVVRLDTAFVLLARRVDLNQYPQLRFQTLVRGKRCPSFLERIGFLSSVHATDAVEIRDLLGERFALVRLQAADHVPSDRLGEESGFFAEFLGIIFAEVEVLVFGIVQGEDVVGGFEF